MGYNVIITRKAEKQLSDIPKVIYRNIREHIDDLANEPRPYGYKQLKGYGNNIHYRIRVGNYRIIYTIEDKILTIEVVKIDNRKDVYKSR
jgi:mRNA interferase RelE/StbE